MVKFQIDGDTPNMTFRFSDYANQGQSKGVVSIFLPEGLQNEVTAEYDGVAGAAIQSDNGSFLANRGRKFLQKGKEWLKKVQTTGDSDFDTGRLTEASQGKVLNKRMEQIFAGMGMRTFNFTWKMIPQEAEDAKKIVEICKLFHTNMAPQTPGEDDRSWLQMPSLVEFSVDGINTPGIKSLPNIRSAITTCSVNYGENMMVQYTDQYVSTTILTVTLQEIRIPTRQDIESLYPAN